MATQTPNSGCVDIVGNRSKSDQEIFSSVLERWQQRFGFWSIFAAVPTVLVSQLHVTPVVEGKKPEVTITGLDARSPGKLNLNESTRSLLKRQSQFRLSSQNAKDASLTSLGEPDDCPGRAIPAGTYTGAVPYIDSGDTNGANNTVNAFYVYGCYCQSIGSPGPDHVYSFILTDRGANPKIEISTTSTTFSPVIYLLEGGFPKACTGDNDGFAWNGLTFSDSANGVATIDSFWMNRLPLNVPLYLLIDSRVQNNAGAYTLKMQDVTIAPPATNAIDESGFFVRQHYRDFLSREPDSPGLAFWTNEITSCGTDLHCVEVKRVNVSAAFFLSIEFQEGGYLVYRFYKSAFGNLAGAPVPVSFSNLLQDAQQIGQGLVVGQAGWQTVLENNKQAYALAFVQRSQFTSLYLTSMSPAAFVDTLFANAGVIPTSEDRAAAINEFGGALSTTDVAARARALRRVAENSTLAQQEFNRAFVLMQYFGYLRRNPNDSPDGNFDGYNFWLNKLNQFNGNFIEAEMVRAFISSIEYRGRFGP